MMRFSDKNSLLTLNTRTGVKKKPFSYSSYWMDFDDPDADENSFDDYIPPEQSNTERIVKMAGVRRSIANFVRILTNDEKIQVVFSSGKESYTDGKKVVISAEDDPKKFDVMVGLALHEGSHCLLSDFSFLTNVITKDKWLNCVLALKPELRNTLPKNWYAVENDISQTVYGYQRILSFLMNIIEDRRIDSYIYLNASGYRPYYDAMYKKYFFSKDVDNNMKHNPDWRIPTVENYINWLINSFNPAFDANALPGLREMVMAIDLKNIRRFDSDKRTNENSKLWKRSTEESPWNSATVTNQFVQAYPKDNLFDYDELPQLWKVANDILYLMIKYIAKSEMDKSCSAGGAGNSGSVTIDGMMIDLPEGELENLDMGQSQVVPGKFNKSKAEKAMKDMKKVMNGEAKKKKLKAKEAADIKQLESADAKITEAGDNIIGKFPCLVTKQLTKTIMMSDWFPFAHCNTKYENNKVIKTDLHTDQNRLAAVAKGFKMGSVLVHRLQVRNDPMLTTYTRQPQGQIDRRILAQLGMDIEQVFKRTTIESFKPVMIHLSIDASGSMSGSKWERSLTVATALAYVASKIRNIDVVITIRGEESIPVVCVIYDSRKDNFQKARSLFPYLHACGSTPEGLCFKATLDLITECSKEYDTYFINFSDGEPGCSINRRGEYKNYTGEQAVQHTRRQVNAIREAGVKVLAYFIGYDSGHYSYGRSNYSMDVFKRMYGADAVFVNVSNITDVLRTLNALLLKK